MKLPSSKETAAALRQRPPHVRRLAGELDNREDRRRLLDLVQELKAEAAAAADNDDYHDGMHPVA
jgi:hypothetical protein